MRLLHQVKAHFPIFVTELGIVTEVRNEQLEKAYSPILVTELGIVTDERYKQLKNAHSPILVTLYFEFS